jgi:CheY-like chemotaxis protein
MTNASSPSRAHGHRPRILIVEDELLIAVVIGEMVRQIGCRVSGTAPTIAMTHLEIAKRNFDAVLLDLNLDGQYHPEIADLLLEYGVPFAFVTGYDYLVEPRHEKIPILQKPFTPVQLRTLLETLVGPLSSADDEAHTA